NVPIVSGAPFGHGKRNLPFPIGLPAVLDTEDLTVDTFDSPVE
ncbi:MAG: muramoyltetrapeptide carboxypeptidase, partial [Deltaproteobacteria bacterium]